MRVALPVLVALLAIRSSTALYCYGCLASTTSDCFNGEIPSYIHQECQVTKDVTVVPSLNIPLITNLTSNDDEEAIKTVCIQFTLPDVHPKVFQRGCGYIYENVDICDYLQNITNVEGCSFCEKHFCNKHPGTLDTLNLR